MKKILVPLVLLVVGITSNAQSTKKEPPPPPPPPKLDITKFQAPASTGIKSQNDFLKRNPTVANLNWQSGKSKTILLKLKSGIEEKYDLTNEVEQKSFTEKYGAAPMQPPPPPPKKVS